ncbi:MAG: histidine--tRNA ligase [Actinobacteria bacterium]|nr:histidine--tRNA ligase [Actinomycetota bacterium]
MTELAPPRGTIDLLPPRSEAMLGLYEAGHELAHRYGFRYVETPSFEHTEVFERTSGGTSDIVTKEMYTFEDKGGRSLTLRPEPTAPVMRAYLAHRHDLPTPFKAYYVSANWRHSRPQAGRLREFRQLGVEVIGTPAPEADVEVVAMADRYLRDRGLRRFALHLNSIGDEACRPAYREELVAYLEGRRDELSDEHGDRFRENPLRVLDCRDEACRRVARDAPLITERLCEACAEHLAAVQAGLRAAGVAFQPDPFLVRGLDYYTRTAFEFVSEAMPAAQSTLCGGGRYDGLAEVLGGAPTPGVGFGLGLDRVLYAMEEEGVELPGPRSVDAFVVAVGDGAILAARGLVEDLRRAGVAAEASAGDRPLKAQLRMADRTGARFAVIVGEREMAEGRATVRRLSDGSQEAVPMEDVPGWISGRA